MSWSVELDAGRGWIVCNLAGEISRAESALATRRALALAGAGVPARFLLDVREAYSRLTVGDLYSIPAMWEHGGADRGSAIALLIPDDPQLRRDAEFFENTCRNRGWNVRVFESPEQAATWLDELRPGTGHAASA